MRVTCAAIYTLLMNATVLHVHIQDIRSEHKINIFFMCVQYKIGIPSTSADYEFLKCMHILLIKKKNLFYYFIYMIIIKQCVQIDYYV